jgi:ankyrin repeat protein
MTYLSIVQKGWTALMAAARANNADIVELLLDRGAALEAEMTVSNRFYACGCTSRSQAGCVFSSKP